MVAGAETGHVGDAGLRGSARIARRREQRAALRRLRQAPRQGVLPAPAPHHQHVHLPGESGGDSQPNIRFLAWDNRFQSLSLGHYLKASYVIQETTFCMYVLCVA